MSISLLAFLYSFPVFGLAIYMIRLIQKGLLAAGGDTDR